MINPLIQIHIADIHFGSINPETQYNILREQFLNQISTIHFDILSIDGDLFDRKFMANSAPIYFATRFVYECIELCKANNAAFILISGTESHDAGQLSLFRDLPLYNSTEIYIIESPQFVYTHGVKILCIPEESGKGEEYYNTFLRETYDMCFLHGTIEGGVYGANHQDLNARRPVFGLSAFSGCMGPIVAGHVHKAMCLNGYMYYVSNPIRYKFGEEEEKGYGILLSNHSGHYYKFMPIESFRYITIDINTLNTIDPDEIVNQINKLQASGIDHIKLVANNGVPGMVEEALNKYYMQNPTIKLDIRKEKPEVRVDTTIEILNKYKGLEFLLDPNINEYEKLSRFVEHGLGRPFITADELKQLILGK